MITDGYRQAAEQGLTQNLNVKMVEWYGGGPGSISNELAGRNERDIRTQAGNIKRKMEQSGEEWPADLVLKKQA